MFFFRKNDLSFSRFLKGDPLQTSFGNSYLPPLLSYCQIAYHNIVSGQSECPCPFPSLELGQHVGLHSALCMIHSHSLALLHRPFILRGLQFDNINSLKTIRPTMIACTFSAVASEPSTFFFFNSSSPISSQSEIQNISTKLEITRKSKRKCEKGHCIECIQSYALILRTAFLCYMSVCIRFSQCVSIFSHLFCPLSVISLFQWCNAASGSLSPCSGHSSLSATALHLCTPSAADRPDRGEETKT